jgi:hypothetical protein
MIGGGEDELAEGFYNNRHWIFTYWFFISLFKQTSLVQAAR